MMNSISEKDRKTLRFGAIGVGLILVVMVGVFPLMDYWDGLNDRVDQSRKKLSDIQRFAQDGLDVTLKQQSLQEKVTLHPDTASLNRQTATMLEQVQKLPAYRTILVQRLEGLPLRTDEKLHRSAVSLQFSGTLPNLHALLAELEGSKPALKVERLTINTERKNPEKIEGQMVIAAFAVVARKAVGTNG